jgi:prolyl-tRNA editing enzyme YbaK/EbsC (Cys-tRNA(Pro) deacylase)
MSIAPTLKRYLTAENIQYEEIPHELTMSSTRTAEACHVSGDRLAKGIVLRRDGDYMLVVMPASHHLPSLRSADWLVGIPPYALATRFPDAEVITLAPDTGFGET